MKLEKRQKLVRMIAKELGINYSLANWPKEIVVKLNAKKGWRVELDEAKGTYKLDSSLTK